MSGRNKPLKNKEFVNESTKVKKIVSPKEYTIKSPAGLLKDKKDNDKIYKFKKENEIVDKFFKYDYVPRLIREHGKKISNKYLEKARNIYDITPIHFYEESNSPTRAYTDIGYKYKYNQFKDYLKYAIDKDPEIYYNTKKIPFDHPTVAHELVHAFRQGYLGRSGNKYFNSSDEKPVYDTRFNHGIQIGTETSGHGYSDKESKFLNNSYDMSGYDPSYPFSFEEKGTTNTEIRYMLWLELYKKLGKLPTLKQTDDFIRNYDSEKLKQMIGDRSSYGWQMYNNGLDDKKVKESLMHVAKVSDDNNGRTAVAKKGIKIKKENRGKFTDYCGGKVTDECIRKAKSSGNKKLIKRATFAENARKWKH